MTNETTRKALYEAPVMGERKAIAAFHALKEMAPNTVIEGYYKGRFESKKKPGAFFIIMEDEASGEAHAYGTCTVLDERLKQFAEKAIEMGQKPESLIFSTTFLGRLPTKSGNTAYKFTGVNIYEPKAPGVAQQLSGNQVAAAMNTNEIPF